MPIKIHIPKSEVYDEINEMFIETDKNYDLILEHSLLSISKWESTWHVPYLETKEKTDEQAYDYLKCMTIGKEEVPDIVYRVIPPKELDRISKYINDSMTATTLRFRQQRGKPEILTSELIYYYMFEAGIPKECEKWHVNRLMTLIGIYGIKRDTGSNKMSRSELIARNKEINEINRRRFHTKG